MEREFVDRRSRYATSTVLTLLVAIAFLALGLVGWAFLVVLAAALQALMYIDANGMVHEVRQRSTRRMATDLSVLSPAGTAKESVSLPPEKSR